MEKQTMNDHELSGILRAKAALITRAANEETEPARRQRLMNAQGALTRASWAATIRAQEA